MTAVQFRASVLKYYNLQLVFVDVWSQGIFVRSLKVKLTVFIESLPWNSCTSASGGSFSCISDERGRFELKSALNTQDLIGSATGKLAKNDVDGVTFLKSLN